MGLNARQYLTTLTLVLFVCAGAFAQTDVVANGSFESGLSGWSVGPSNLGGGNAGNCGYNADTAPGTETLTGTAGFAATGGTEIALGSVKQTAGSRYGCVLYQDVSIPAGASIATLRADIGVKYLNGMTSSYAAIQYGLFPTTSVPNDWWNGGVLLAGGGDYYQPATSSSALTTRTVPAFNISSLAGTTARLAFILVTNGSTGEFVGVIDKVSLEVSFGPMVIGISPTHGPAAGGTSVIISGTNFTGVTAVRFGATNAASYTVDSATQITAVSPSASSGVVDVRVTAGGFTSAASSADQFTYAIVTPTLSEWGMILLVVLLSVAGYFLLRRQYA